DGGARISSQPRGLRTGPRYRCQPALPVQADRRGSQGRQWTAGHRGARLARERGPQQSYDRSRSLYCRSVCRGSAAVLLLRPPVRGARSGRGSGGFTLIEMIVVVFLLALAMLGILAVFDASARINKSEQQVADAEGAVRYGIYQMTPAIRMGGAGGVLITQADLNRSDRGTNMGGIMIVMA